MVYNAKVRDLLKKWKSRGNGMEYILETHNLEKKYKNFKALDNFNMHIPKGAIYGLIGKNGAGKTTAIRLICGLQKPTNGTYSIYGILNTNKEIITMRKRMGAIVETPSISFDMTAEENLIEQYKILGISSYDTVKEILEIVKLSNTGRKKAKNFSLGMRQRLGIAIALAGNPDILVLDEPINGLDPEGIIEIRELILKLNKEKGITFLISSHYLDELSKIATYYGFVDNGRVIKEISSKELENNCKRRIEITVNNVKECVKYLEKNKISYEVISDNTINIYDNINITDFSIELSNKNCVISEFHEKEETLENYYINLIGGGDNV